MLIQVFYLIVFGFFIQKTSNQPEPILLQNPSFEDTPGASRMPQGWFYCGELGESPPDVHPSGNFGVEHAPKHGFTYIGMVVRDNNTWEGVSQWLSEPLQAGQCYEFSLFAARSPRYESLSRTTWQAINFDKPVRLLLWGGQLNCEKRELLAASPLIESTDWQQYIFRFQPQEAHSRLLIEAQYAEDAEPYCGNVLLDHASPLLPIDCDNQQVIARIDTVRIENPTDRDAFVKMLENLAAQVKFSTIDQHPQQHVFYLPNGELYQGNPFLYKMVQNMILFPETKATFYIIENNKPHYRSKMEALGKELMLNGLPYEQFVIKRLKKPEDRAGEELWVEVR